ACADGRRPRPRARPAGRRLHAARARRSHQGLRRPHPRHRPDRVRARPDRGGRLRVGRHTRPAAQVPGASFPEGRRLMLEVSNATMRFGGLVAVSKANLSVRPGSITGLIGPNGAGKTTLFAIIAGFLKPTEGTVTWLGEDITR